MILEEIIHTCSNPRVAAAALASIGVAVSGDFLRLFSAEASRRGLPREVYAARMVIAFGESADEQERARVRRALWGADLPLLSGLQFILDRGLRADLSHNRAPRRSRSRWMAPKATCSDVVHMR